MCFDISSTKIKQLVKKNQTAIFYKDFDYQPFYHASGFTYPTLSLVKTNEPRIIYPSTWGFIPEWGQGNISGFRKKYNTLNAKGETLLSSKMFSESAKDQRCIIIADGFFEPHLSYGNKIPYYCYIPSDEYDDGRDLFAFAGVYSETDNHNSTCSIITTEANDFFSEINNVKKRMPLILQESLLKDWLDSNISEKQITEILKEGFTKKDFKAHSVNKNLYQRKNYINKETILNEINYKTLFDI